MLLVKTHKNTLLKVIEFSKHALHVKPKRLSQDEIILIAQTKKDLSPRDKPIQYCMEFYRIYADNENESDKIWKKHWNYILEGRNCRPLKQPFDISEVQVSNYNYKQGGTFTYVVQEDIDVLYKKGYLEIL